MDEAYVLAIVPSSTTGLAITGDQRLVERLTTDVRDEKLTIRQSGREPACLFCHHEPLQVTLYTSNTLEQITLGGAVRAHLEHPSSSRLRIELYDAARLTMTGTTDQLDVKATGAANLIGENVRTNQLDLALKDVARATLHLQNEPAPTTVRLHLQDTARVTVSGRAVEGVVTLQDVSRLDASELLIDTLRADLRGASHADVHALTRLEASTRDVSILQYAGSPTTTFTQEDTSRITRE